MKKFYTLLAAAAVSVSAMAWDAPNPMYEHLYLIGDPCDQEKATVEGATCANPAAGWEIGNGFEMTQTSAGIFEISVELKAACWFAFNPELGDPAEGWDPWNAKRLTPANGTQKAEAGANPMMIAGSPDSWMLTEGNYTFVVNCNTGIFNIEGNVETKIGTLYLRGDMNGWLNGASEDEMAQWAFTTEDEVVYTLAGVALPAAYLEGDAMVGVWKIANSDWTAQFVATVEEGDATALVLDTPYFYTESDPGYNNGMAEAVENATITLDLDEETITITAGGAGVQGVLVEENVAPVYYNLQGVRIANPENGLFIKVCGKTASKVIL